MLVGLTFLSATLGSHPDESVRGLGICVFALGGFIGAAGLYIKARATGSNAPAASTPKAPKRVRGGCDLCGAETASPTTTIFVLALTSPALAAPPVLRPQDSQQKPNSLFSSIVESLVRASAFSRTRYNQ